MNLTSLEWILTLSTSWSLFGLIWIIQLVHYPTFSMIARDEFAQFHQHHTSSIGKVVLPLMLGEMSLSCWLASGFGSIEVILLLIVFLIWASTFFIQVPLHNRLANGKDSVLIQKLVSTNWIRTILWSLKAIVVGYFFILWA